MVTDHPPRIRPHLSAARGSGLLPSFMTNSLDLEHLRNLVAIKECGGFSKAAAVRHISQPALSRHVRAEREGVLAGARAALGVALLPSVGGRPAGEQLVASRRVRELVRAFGDVTTGA